LGLSIVHGFAAQSGGSVQLTSSPGRGTRVDLWLPRAEGEATQWGDIEPEQSAAEPSQARILVCDDDVDVLSFIGTVLRDAGYTVWEADSPTLALQIFESEWPLDLLLVDYAMPEMNGVTLIGRAQECQRPLKVLLMSGHAAILDANGAPGVPLLRKPFELAELRGRVAEILFGAIPGGGADRSDRLFAASD
jgi:CheY-like chemotaxis protein